MSLAARWVESGEQPADFYDLAGLARFHPRADEVVAALTALAAEARGYLGHWQPEFAARSQQVQEQVQQALGVFSAPAARQHYDEQLWQHIRQSFAREFRGAAAGEAVRRWLRMIQHVHPSRLEESVLRLTRGGPAPEPVSAVSTVTAAKDITQPAPPKPAAGAPPARPADRPKPPAFREQPQAAPDDYGVMWVVGSALLTAIVFIVVLFAVFGSRFGRGRPTPVVAQGDPPPVTAPPKPAEAPTPAPSTAPQNPPPMSQETNSLNPPPTPTPAPVPAATPPAPVPPPMPAAAPPAPALAADPSRRKFDFGKAVHAIAFSNSGLLAVGGEGGEVALWDPATIQAPRVSEQFTGCTSLAFSGSGRTLAIGTADSSVLLWNVGTSKLERQLKHDDLTDARSAVWTVGTGDPLVAVGDGAGCVRLFSATGGNQQAVLDLATDAGPIQTLLRGSKSPPLVFAAHLDGTVVVWNLGARNIVKCLAPSGAAIRDALQKPNATGSKAAEVTTWPHDACYGLALSPDEKLLAVAARDLELWELDSPKFAVRRRLLPGADDAKAYRHVAFSSDGLLLAAGNAQGTWSIVDPLAWTVLVQEKLPAAITALAWHPTERRRLAIATEDGQVTLVALPADVTSRKAAPDFDPAHLLATAKTVVANEEWHDCVRLLCVVAAYPLSLSNKQEFDNLRFKAKKAVGDLVSAVQPKSVADDEIEDAALNLQLAIDLDPTGQLGKEARDKLRLLPPQTPESIAKAAAAAEKAAAAGKSRSRPPLRTKARAKP